MRWVGAYPLVVRITLTRINHPGGLDPSKAPRVPPSGEGGAKETVLTIVGSLDSPSPSKMSFVHRGTERAYSCSFLVNLDPDLLSLCSREDATTLDLARDALISHTRRIFKFVAIKSGREVNQVRRSTQIPVCFLGLHVELSCAKLLVLLRVHLRQPQPQLPPLREDGTHDMEEGR